MKVTFLSYGMTVKTVPLILYLIALTILLSLGFWQLDRAESKRLLLASQQQKSTQKAHLLSDIYHNMPETLRYQNVELRGRYLANQQFLIDNQMQAGKLGYFVLTPFVLSLSKKIVLVNRGWVAAENKPLVLPNITFSPIDEDMRLIGVVNDFPGVGLVLDGADEPSDSWPSVVQIINPEKIAKKLQRSILNFQVQLSPEQDNGYYRQWTIHGRIPPEKHVAYAFQWFALAATLTFLLFWVSFRTKE